ncbi:hypothetical protein HDU96_007862, partial [Phlyctochytrium bullatum]
MSLPSHRTIHQHLRRPFTLLTTALLAIAFLVLVCPPTVFAAFQLAEDDVAVAGAPSASDSKADA